MALCNLPIGKPRSTGQRVGHALGTQCTQSALRTQTRLPCFRTGDVPKGGNITLTRRSRGQTGRHAL